MSSTVYPVLRLSLPIDSFLRVYKNVYIILLLVSFLSISLVYYTNVASSSRTWSQLQFKKLTEAVTAPLWSSSDGNMSVSGGDGVSRPFKILFWTTWYGYAADGSKEFVMPECKDEFIITSNKSEFGEADVIIFQFVDIFRAMNFHYPFSRDIDVPWILASQEASIQYPLVNHTRFDQIFNWTWSSRSDSLIHPNFTEMFKKSELPPNKRWVFGSDFSKEFLSNKTKTGAWVVSNCKVVRSKRNELVASLSKQHGVQIDIYGKCGNLSCENGDKCFSTLGLSYKFYFALENSLCEDYITEKIYHGLLHGMVPVVYALGNVGMNAPPNSFINVLDFPTLSDLAERLKYLDRNPQEYFKYLEWRQLYNVNVTGSARYQCYTYRKMKEYTLKLRSDEDFKYRHVYENFTDWYTRFYNVKLGRRCEACLSPQQINITHLSQNKVSMYENPSRCV